MVHRDAMAIVLRKTGTGAPVLHSIIVDKRINLPPVFLRLVGYVSAGCDWQSIRGSQSTTYPCADWRVHVSVTEG